MDSSEIFKKNRHIIVFDGLCNLCSGFLQFVYKRERKQIFKYAWIQEESGKQIMDLLNLPGEKSDTIVLIDEGIAYTKSTAFLRISTYLKYPWPLLNIGYLLPLFIRDSIYDWVAANRYKWFGKKAACMIPTGAIGERFLSVNSSTNSSAN